MHSMHQLQAHNESSGHVQQPPQQSIGGPIQENHANASIGQDQQTSNMTVLVQLDAAQPNSNQVPEQPVLSGLEPVQQQPLGNRAMQSAANQQAPIIHHLAHQQQQHQAHQQAQPQLHVLRAPCIAKTDQQEHLEHLSEPQSMGQQHAQQAHSSRPAASRQQQHQQQLEGSTAETQEMVNRWLLENYEIADGESLPRSTVYNHYISYCRHLRTTPQNAASFGKQIRSVFVGLKTRRLGTRGHSKYHYFGIRAKNHVNLEWLQASEQAANSHEAQRRRAAGCSSMMHDPSQENSNTDQGSESDSNGDNHSGRLSSLGGSVSNNATSCTASKRPRRLNEAPELVAYGQAMDHQAGHYDEMIDSNQNYAPTGVYYSNGYIGKQDRGWPLDQVDLSGLCQHLGANSERLVDDNWPHREQALIESQLNERLRSRPTCDESGNPVDLAGLIQVFENQYKCCYKRMVDMLSQCQFNGVARLWAEFWRSSTQPEEKHDEANQWPPSDAPNTNGNQYHHRPMEASQHLSPQEQAHMQHEQHHLVYRHHADQQMISNAAEMGLTFNQLYQLTSLSPVVERISEIDRKLFAAIETFLVPDLLSPVPRALIHHVRVFARDFGIWMESLMKDYPNAFVVEKLKSTRAFEHALNRYTSINHLATSSRAIWTRRSVLTQMSMDLNRIDLRDIEHQVSLMSQAKYDRLLGGDEQHQGSNDMPANGDLGHRDQQSMVGHNGSANNHNHNSHNNNNTNHSNNATSLHQAVHDDTENSYLNNGPHIYSNQTDHSPVHRAQAAMQPAQLIQHFLHLLEDPYPANMWPDWCRNLVESRVRGQSLEEARNFILKWNFYVSLIMRELTLRSAPSLGSFQLIRLLFDEYMYYLVVMRLAQVQHKTSIQLMTSSMKFDGLH